MCVPHWHQLRSKGNQQGLHVATDPQGVLQSTRRVEGDSALRGWEAARVQLPAGLSQQPWQKLGKVPSQLNYPPCFVRIGGGITKQLRVILHHGAAPGGIDDNGLDPRRLDGGPPRIDVAAKLIAGSRMIIQMLANGSA